MNDDRLILIGMILATVIYAGIHFSPYGENEPIGQIIVQETHGQLVVPSPHMPIYSLSATSSSAPGPRQ